MTHICQNGKNKGMGIASLNNRSNYIGNNTTSTYQFNFKIFSNSHLLVTKKDANGIETELSLNTDYSVTDGSVNNESGGTITLSAGNLPTGQTLTIRRLVPLTQETDLRNQGQYYPESIEDAFDYGRMADQQQQDSIDRSLKLAETVDTANFNATLPATIQGVANGYLATNTAGDGLSVIQASLSDLDVPAGNGFVGKVGTGSNLRQLEGTATEITVTNGDGVSGNPTVSLAGVPFTKLTCAIDDDTMGTASATTVPTSESAKAYVDSKDLNPTLTTQGDLFVRGASAVERIGIGAADQVLTVESATSVVWKDNPAKKVVGMPNSYAGASDGGYRSGGVILNDGTLRTWGYGSYKNLGIGGGYSHARSFPIQPAFPFGVTGNIVKWERSGQDNLLLMDNGHVYGWGRNAYGVLGTGNTNQVPVPIRITSLSSYNIVDISMGKGYNTTQAHALFLTNDGKVLASGYNGYGQLGIGNTTNQSTPQLLTKTDWAKIYTSNDSVSNSAGIDTSGNLYTWGYNGQGQLGIGSTTNQSTPQFINAFGGVSVSEVSIATNVNSNNSATYGYAVALLSSGAVYTWGYNGSGNLGTGNTTQYTTPQHISGLGTDNIQVLASSGDYGATYVVKANNGGIHSTGYNNHGQQGNGTTTAKTSFSLMSNTVRSGRTISKIHTVGSLSDAGFAVLWDDGVMKVCGYNSNGNLGVGFTGNVTALTEVVGFMRHKPVKICTIGRAGEASLGVLTEEGVYYQTGYGGDSQRPSDDAESIDSFQPVQIL